MSESRALVEHYFRHEFGRLGAVLTRSLGVGLLAPVEDVVQAAVVQALETWYRRGVLEDLAGWLCRTARNLVIDALRREQTHAEATSRLRRDARHLAEDAERESSSLEAHFAGEICDEPLRLRFVCCHEAVPAASRASRPRYGGVHRPSIPVQPVGAWPHYYSFPRPALAPGPRARSHRCGTQRLVANSLSTSRRARLNSSGFSSIG